MVGLWRIEEGKPKQQSKQHSSRPERVGELASHAANIRLGDRRYRLITTAIDKSLGKLQELLLWLTVIAVQSRSALWLNRDLALRHQKHEQAEKA